MPSSVTKGRDVGVEIKSSHLKVWLKRGASPESGTVLSCQGKVIVVNILNVTDRQYNPVLFPKTRLQKKL